MMKFTRSCLQLSIIFLSLKFVHGLQADEGLCEAREDSPKLALSGRLLTSESGCKNFVSGYKFQIFFKRCKVLVQTRPTGDFNTTLPIVVEKDGQVQLMVCFSKHCLNLSLDVSLINEPVVKNSSLPSSNTIYEQKKYEIKNDLCISGLDVRREKREASEGDVWDDQDMNWLKRNRQVQKSRKIQKENENESDGSVPITKELTGKITPVTSKQSVKTTNLRRLANKRLWEDAGEEVGWVKRPNDKNWNKRLWEDSSDEVGWIKRLKDKKSKRLWEDSTDEVGWMKRNGDRNPKRLWEDSSDEVGWIKRLEDGKKKRLWEDSTDEVGWMKRSNDENRKRLWEDSSDEVGWIKRSENPRKKKLWEDSSEEVGWIKRFRDEDEKHNRLREDSSGKVGWIKRADDKNKKRLWEDSSDEVGWIKRSKNPLQKKLWENSTDEVGWIKRRDEQSKYLRQKSPVEFGNGRSSNYNKPKRLWEDSSEDVEWMKRSRNEDGSQDYTNTDKNIKGVSENSNFDVVQSEKSDQAHSPKEVEMKAEETAGTRSCNHLFQQDCKR